MKMTISLNQPGMTSLHKVGLAGLYMTLRAFDKTGVSIEGCKWDLQDPTGITLFWETDDLKKTFAEFIDASFRLEDGFVVLPGLEMSRPMSIEKRHHLYVALLNSFLQFGPHRPTGSKQTLTYEVDEHRCWIKDFAPIKEYRHRQAVSDFIDESLRFRKSVEVSGWLYPGAGQRHVVYNNTKHAESPELGLVLMYAPVGAIFYTVRARTTGRKTRLAMLLPEIRNLHAYSELRQILAAQGVLELTASSGSDAGLRLLATLEANRARLEISTICGGDFHCRITTFGIVDWNEKQKSRTYSRLVLGSKVRGLDNYFKAAAIFTNRWQTVNAKYDRRGNQVEPERAFVTTYSVRELIADNVVRGRHWYFGLAEFLAHKEAREQIMFERKEMYEMVESARYEEDSELLFIRLCHESWRRRLGKLGQRATREGAVFSTLVSKESEKLRNSLSRCKNSDTLRETVVDFWARGGSNELLRGEGLSKLLRLFDDRNWKKARDLTLLALISYQPQNREEEKALAVTQEFEGEDE